jgi:hypothetical protein
MATDSSDNDSDWKGSTLLLADDVHRPVMNADVAHSIVVQVPRIAWENGATSCTAVSGLPQLRLSVCHQREQLPTSCTHIVFDGVSQLPPKPHTARLTEDSRKETNIIRSQQHPSPRMLRLSWATNRTQTPPPLLPSEYCRVLKVQPQISPSAPIIRILPATNTLSRVVSFNASRTATPANDSIDAISISRSVDGINKQSMVNELHTTDVRFKLRVRMLRISWQSLMKTEITDFND